MTAQTLTSWKSSLSLLRVSRVFDEQVIQRDLLQLPVDVLFGLLGHVLLLGVSLMVMT
ncbi:hypothetical protein [Luteimonas huabeiensis]|uniref:hypothetical protein n=1 Tax=Luteimonas huabeiensis TaxID=1244513 RepID=UPI0004BC4346|nr:hypothetical protein [Luteimonas huabeiensis]